MKEEARWLVEVSPAETRAALVDPGGVLLEFRVERLGRDDIVGSIRLGRVIRVDKALGAAFVEIGEAQPGFLGKAKQVTEGERLIVQVVRGAGGGKGAVVTVNPLLAGRYVVLDPTRPGTRMPPRWPGDKAAMAARLEAIVTEGAGLMPCAAVAAVEDAVLASEVDRLTARWKDIQAEAGAAKPPAELAAAPRLWDRLLCEMTGPMTIDDPAVFAMLESRVKRTMPDLVGKVGLYRGGVPLFEECGVEEQMEAALAPAVNLPGGASLVIQETEALTAVDVNMGGSGGRRPPETAILEANRAAAYAAARQVRLRNLGGLIAIDFISMKSRGNRRAIVDMLRRAMRDDPARHDVLGMTAGGLVEITRQRAGPPLAALYVRPRPLEPLPLPEAEACAALRAAMRATWAGRPLLSGSPELIAALEGPLAAAVAQVSRKLGRDLELRAERGRAGFEISSA